MDNIQLYHIDNEINKVDEMKEGDVIYKNGVELLVVLSYDHNEPCKGCFFYEDKACGSERLIKCWDCKKEYIFTAIRKYNTTELCGIVKRYEETYKIILKTIKKIEKECQKYVIWDTVHVMLKDDGELIIKALSKDKSVLLNDFIIYVNNNGSIDEDHTGSCTIRKMTKSNGAPRTDSLRNMPAVIGMDGDRLNGRVFQLSPLFVEEMMGYPLMWTTLPFLTGNGEKNQ